MMTFWKSLLSMSAALIVSLSAFGASASTITYNFAGTLTSSFGTLNSGDPFSGSYRIDSSVAAAGGSTSSFSVFNDLLSVSLTVGSFSATIGPGSGLPELQQDNVAGADRYGLVGRNPVGSSQIGGLDISSIGFRLDDTTGTAISDALILLTNPTLSSFTSNTFLLFFGVPNDGGFAVVTGTLSSLSTVPEPATLVLLGLGLAGLGLARLGFSRRKQ
jgi:hypothetical protein